MNMFRHPHFYILGILAIIATAIALVIPSVFRGSQWVEQAMLVPDRKSDHLNQSVALDGDTAVVGDSEYAFKGAALVYNRSGNTWTLQAKLSIPKTPTEKYNDFGKSVAIDGDTILVAANDLVATNNATILPLYIFTRSENTWSLQTQPTLPTLPHPPKTRFIDVNSVALAGDTAVAGTRGKVYVFRRYSSKSTWSYEAELKSPKPAYEFGETVAIDGSTIIVGRSCGAFVFVRDLATSRWSLQAELVPRPSNASSCRTTVDISGNTAVVGIPGEKWNRGAAYVYEQSSVTGEWLQKARLVLDDVPPFFFIYGFGGSVGIDGKTIVVGISLEHRPSSFGFQLTPFKQSVYVFERNSYTGWWSYSTKLQPQNMVNDWYLYGRRVSISGNNVMITAPAGTSNSANIVYIFKRIEPSKK
jgi:hypothetical protein